MSIRRKHIRNLAEGLLRRLNIRKGPVPVDDIAELLGIIIQKRTFDSEGYIWFSFSRSRNKARGNWCSIVLTHPHDNDLRLLTR